MALVRLRRMSTNPSLRQRKKERTRAKLVSVSRRLFSEQGYEETTLEQICAEAEVSVPTLLVYFESKERLALASEYDAFNGFRALIEDPGRALDAVAIWRQRVEADAAAAMESPSRTLRRDRFLNSSPVLARGLLALIRQFEHTLCSGLATDHGTDPEADLATALLATTLVWSPVTVRRHWITEGGKGDLRGQALAVLDLVVQSFPGPGRRIAR